jgi:Uma2 family endonuclease
MTRLALPAARRNSRHRPPRMTYVQFLEWDGDNQHVEWVNGQVVPMAPISGPHNDTGHFLIAAFRIFIDHFDLGEIRSDPFQMKTGPDLPGRAPDLLFVSKRNLRRLHRTYLEGPADLVIEIISPDSRTLDRVTKFREYEEGGVREYWLIDPERRWAEFYRRGRDGRFRLVRIGEDVIFRSATVKGLWIRIGWLWTPPELLDVFREWKLL